MSPAWDVAADLAEDQQHVRGCVLRQRAPGHGPYSHFPAGRFLTKIVQGGQNCET
jgi:hypothetical protein